MKKESPFISKLYPKDRVSQAERGENDNYYRVILDEPVYFNLKPNSDFKEARILVRYKFIGKGNLKLGGLVNKQNWAFDFVEMPGTKKDEWSALAAEFDLSKLVKEKENFRFMFSAPELSSGQLTIGEIKVEFRRESMTFREATDKIVDAVMQKIN
jgi:hypothetical protein